MGFTLEGYVFLAIIIFIIAVPVIGFIIYNKQEKEYRDLLNSVLADLQQSQWKYNDKYDKVVNVKSKATANSYTNIKILKNDVSPTVALAALTDKIQYAKTLQNFLDNNNYTEHKQYDKLKAYIINIIKNCSTYNVKISYVSPAGNVQYDVNISFTIDELQHFIDNPQELMSKSEYNKQVKEQQQEALNQLQHVYYEKVNEIIDFANVNRDLLLIKDDQLKMDQLVSQLFDKTISNIKKIKTADSDEWKVLGSYIKNISTEISKLVNKTKQILDYYSSEQFSKIKQTCESLMATQREFNEYIDEKAQSISKLFGTRAVRTETVVEDDYNYVRPYKKSITPFTAEVSAAVFASAENNPINYIIKYFYPDKNKWTEQIQKLQMLIEELETLKEAKQIIENYKKDYQQYIQEVPDYVMKYDSDGFYARLGFATINENILTVEYKFSYTSNGGFSQRSFTVPMSEETIIQLIETLQSKLNQSTFSKEQRRLMTGKLRQKIKERDNFTCKYCGNSIYKEPNLLLEVDHITPIAKGGYTVEDNLQTLCWKCNRSKGSKLA